MSPQPTRTFWLLAGIAIISALALVIPRGTLQREVDPPAAPSEFLRPVSLAQEVGPSLSGGVDWINSAPLTMEDLRGKVVLLDFWTFCCINCHHVLPDLARLEAKYKNELVVIGVHTPKFPAERETENIRRKVREYRIKHPVINDANQVLWERFGIQSWPTLALITPEGQLFGMVAGEGHYSQLDRAIGRLIALYQGRGELNRKPIKFNPEMNRPSEGPLLFPGKVFADAPGHRLFVSDTGHNRIVQAGIDGKGAIAIGSGAEGFVDGGYDEARFNRPQGVFLDGETLYVADTENHAIRAVDLKAHTVTTVAGTGKQLRKIVSIPFTGPAKTTPLSSPWDIIRLPNSKVYYIAMAGPHQIWKLDVHSEKVGVFAGSGWENILDGHLAEAKFAQPSGLATDGEHLFVADSEVSGVRMITAVGGRGTMVRTIVGKGLFAFGDEDGEGEDVRLQHCLGLAYGNGHLYIADTYNNKIKECVPKTHTVQTFVGSHQPGDSDDPPRFYEPGGLSLAGNELYVADTNNHKIRVVDLKTKAVRTLTLEGVTAPKPSGHRPNFRNATVIEVPAVKAAPGKSLRFSVALDLPRDLHLNEDSPMLYLVEASKAGVLSDEVSPNGERIKPRSSFKINVPLAQAAADGETIELRVSLLSMVCRKTSSVCFIRSTVWNVPVTFSAETKAGTPIPLKATLSVAVAK